MWKYKNKTDFTIPEGAVGFTYEIRRINLFEDFSSPYLYIGKKQCFGKGKSNKGKESNWREYWGSSNYLNEDIEKYGKHCFERHILEFCYSYNELNYKELELQMDLRVLAYNERCPMPKKYYNYNVIQKLYKDRYFDEDDISSLDSYVAEDLNRPYPLHLTDDNINLLLPYGIYNIPAVFEHLSEEFPHLRVGTCVSDTTRCITMIDVIYNKLYPTKFNETHSPMHKDGKQCFVKHEEINSMVSDGWIIGAYIPPFVEDSDVLLVINIDTYKRESVTKEQYENGPYAKVNEKPIEVKLGKESIFKGYRKKFCEEFEHDMSTRWINSAVKKARTNSWQDLNAKCPKKANLTLPQGLLVRVISESKLSP